MFQLLAHPDLLQKKLGPQTLPEIPQMLKDDSEEEQKVTFPSLLVTL